MVRGGPARRRLALTATAVAAAYSATGEAWQTGPARIYDRLAEVVVAHSPVPVAGATVLDVGAGTGAAGRAARSAGAAHVVSVDAARGMLAHDPAGPVAAVGDVLSMPFRTAHFGVSVAAFVLNHLADPARGLAEMRRVTRPGGAVVAAVYAADDGHPVKDAVDAALAARGWTADRWYAELRDGVLALLATVDGCAAAMAAAGLKPHVDHVRVPFPQLDGYALVQWRLGLAQHAPFFASLSPEAQRAVVEEAVARLGDPPEPLVRSILIMSAVRR